MAVLLSDSLHGDVRVLHAGDRALGSWVQMLSWLSHWPDQEFIPPYALRMFRATPRIIRSLVEADLLEEVPGGWAPLGEGDLWKFHRPVSRPKIPERIRAFVMDRDNYRCQNPNCGATENLSLDHIIPYSRGGPDTPENLRVFCRSCNSSRGNRAEDADG